MEQVGGTRRFRRDVVVTSKKIHDLVYFWRRLSYLQSA